ncbi:auxin-responsive protein SAUR50-like [Zingiber officinale]|uniref:SAUR family protein n=1 Tax=Zingiber officinale TaxID=94328 RepID=A0A8J5GI46_ZINOF|nr:auxin-responsive protein SAUR50-like [Zingiber officinale]KAG6501062.1 hypothetical protein ZIOFF_040929 [Zingiber officinale]
MKKLEGFRKIGQLKHVIRKWRSLTLGCGSVDDGGSTPPPGSLPVYVGPDQQRFVIPIRALKFPAVYGLLRLKEEQYAFPVRDVGCLVFPCDPDFFGFVLDTLNRDEARYGNMSLDAFVALFSDLSNSEAANDSPCRYSSSCNTFSRLLTRTTSACSTSAPISPRNI